MRTRQRAKAEAEAFTEVCWLPEELQCRLIDFVLEGYKTPVLRNGLIANPARDLVSLMLVCRTWRDRVGGHPHTAAREASAVMLKVAWLTDAALLTGLSPCGQSKLTRLNRIPRSGSTRWVEARVLSRQKQRSVFERSSFPERVPILALAAADVAPGELRGTVMEVMASLDGNFLCPFVVALAVVKVVDPGRPGAAREFTVGIQELVSGMRYFSDLVAQKASSSEGPLEISVHCDVEVFGWLMDRLVTDCLTFMAQHLSEVLVPEHVLEDMVRQPAAGRAAGAAASGAAADDEGGPRGSALALVNKLYKYKLEGSLRELRTTLARCSVCQDYLSALRAAHAPWRDIYWHVWGLLDARLVAAAVARRLTNSSGGGRGAAGPALTAAASDATSKEEAEGEQEAGAATYGAAAGAQQPPPHAQVSGSAMRAKPGRSSSLDAALAKELQKLAVRLQDRGPGASQAAASQQQRQPQRALGGAASGGAAATRDAGLPPRPGSRAAIQLQAAAKAGHAGASGASGGGCESDEEVYTDDDDYEPADEVDEGAGSEGAGEGGGREPPSPDSGNPLQRSVQAALARAQQRRREEAQAELQAQEPYQPPHGVQAHQHHTHRQHLQAQQAPSRSPPAAVASPPPSRHTPTTSSPVSPTPLVRPERGGPGSAVDAQAGRSPAMQARSPGPGRRPDAAAVDAATTTAEVYGVGAGSLGAAARPGPPLLHSAPAAAALETPAEAERRQLIEAYKTQAVLSPRPAHYQMISIAELPSGAGDLAHGAGAGGATAARLLAHRTSGLGAALAAAASAPAVAAASVDVNYRMDLLLKHLLACRPSTRTATAANSGAGAKPGRSGAGGGGAVGPQRSMSRGHGFGAAGRPLSAAPLASSAPGAQRHRARSVSHVMRLANLYQPAASGGAGGWRGTDAAAAAAARAGGDGAVAASGDVRRPVSAAMRSFSNVSTNAAAAAAMGVEPGVLGGGGRRHEAGMGYGGGGSGGLRPEAGHFGSMTWHLDSGAAGGPAPRVPLPRTSSAAERRPVSAPRPRR
eukprot:XP_001700439.1 predicted protein [Chlamydomonas reinhardtii]